MDRISKIVKSIPIPIFFILIVTLFLMLANFLSTKTSNLLQKEQMEIYEKYGLRYGLQDVGDGVTATFVVDLDFSKMSDRDIEKFNLILLGFRYCYLFWYTISIITCAILFYYLKLSKPIKKLNYATKKLAHNDLDFELISDSNDELGKLCKSYEEMRENLYDNNKKMWRMIEDHKILTSALSHDIRTPLTILKGNTEMMLKYIPNNKIDKTKMIEMLESMSHNITRLEDFVTHMSTIVRIEQIEPKYKKVNLRKLTEDLQENTKCLCKDKKIDLDFNINIIPQNVFVDENMIHEVYNNVLYNAYTYTKDKISVHIENTENMLNFEIMDNGNGFSDKALKEGTHIYFKENKDTNHFGLGLYISKILTEKHHGSILLSNTNHGARVKFSFSYQIGSVPFHA